MKRSREAGKKLESAMSCTVLAWGNNTHGQCGAGSNKGLLLHPKEIKELRNKPVESLAAGHRTSCAVLKSGAVLGWGFNSSGQLGLSVSSDVARPTPVDAFQGHARVAAAAMGRSHSLFLDSKGAVWACGDNNYGQLGLGNPAEPFAQAVQAEWSLLTAPSPMAEVAMSGNGQRVFRMAQMRQTAMGLSGFNVSAWLAPPATQVVKQRELLALSQHVREAPSYSEVLLNNASAASKGILGEFAGHSLLAVQGIQDGHYHTPVRIGRDEHPLFRPPTSFAASSSRAAGVDAADPCDDDVSDASASGNARMWYDLTNGHIGPPPRGLGGRTVRRLSTFEEEFASYSRGLHGQSAIKVAATKNLSAVLTARGEVWTFGRGLHNELGAFDAVQSSARPVRGRIARIIQEHGGAVDIAVGSQFCLALARDGSVIAWGNLPTAPEPDAGVAYVLPSKSQGLPPMVHIAAGSTYALMSDGERVYMLGHMSPGPRIARDQAIAAWHEPQVLSFQGIGAASVRQLAAAGRAGAMVDSDSRLWMWGRLAGSSSHDEPELKLHDGKAVMPCLNSFTKPVQVPGIGSVFKVGLGVNHILAAVAR